eukprot:scaffold1214_cov136-Isochrysis_galbana.AAC.5
MWLRQCPAAHCGRPGDTVHVALVCERQAPRSPRGQLTVHRHPSGAERPFGGEAGALATRPPLASPSAMIDGASFWEGLRGG